MKNELLHKFIKRILEYRENIEDPALDWIESEVSDRYSPEELERIQLIHVIEKFLDCKILSKNNYDDLCSSEKNKILLLLEILPKFITNDKSDIKMEKKINLELYGRED